ncbi:MAG: tetratricopeptide repeat protein, partial [Ignavibacteriales bacterium]|nr:tetratricopeptide repeat protein [Ignavibacteriales bacterium]
MMKKKIIGIVVVLMLFGGGVYYLKYRQAPKNDLLTLSPRVGNATASSEFLNAQRAVSFYRDEIAKHPDIIKNYVELAQLFLQEGRVTGRHHEYVPKAQSLLDEALKRDPNNYDANIIKASMLLTMHQFMQAKEIAERMVTKSPHTAIGYGVLCDALVELGEYEHAVEACDEMLKARPDLRSYSRASYLRELHGDLAGAIEAMQLAAETGIAGQENRAWALYNLGKLFLNAGKLDTAAYIFNGILEERPAYAYALSGLAMVNKVRGT